MAEVRMPDNDTERTSKDKKVEKVVVKPVKVKKKSKIASAFMAEDIASVGSYIVQDVVVPAIKKTVSELVSSGVDMMLYGEARPRYDRDRRYRDYYDRPSYRDYYDRDRRRYDDRDRDRYRDRSRSVFEYDDIIFATRGEAERALDQLNDLIAQYNIATVADLYEMADMNSNFTDNKYGWSDLRSATVVPVKDGFMIRLPKAYPIN